jgi:uncharacterized membrane protein
MRKFVAIAVVLVFFGTAMAGATLGAKTSEGPVAGRPMATADGLYWQDDRRLTSNPTDDTLPVLVVDSFGFSHVMWYRSGTHMYQKINRYGDPAFQEKSIVSAPMPTQHCGQATERIGIDAQENFHVVWNTRDSLYGPMYQKFASNGNPLCQPINLAPMATNPHVSVLAVGKNNRGYIAYENEGSERIEMAYVDSSFNLHTGYLSTTSGEGVTIGLNKKDDSYIFSKAWTGTGMWVTKFSSEGNLLMPPTKVDTPVAGSGWDSPLPALAFTDDGAIHMLQASRASGVRSLYYTKLGPDGTKLTNDIPLTQNSADYGDICADSKKNVYIIWGDSTDGELYYVRIQYGQENATLQPVRLTQASGASMNPQISVDPEDSLHVAWQDDRDGNKEVYYKFAFSYGVELGMPPEEMAKMMYVHPNETKMANITVRNMGGQNDTMWMGINADFYEKQGGVGKDYKGNGWKVWLDERYSVLDMEAQEVRKVSVYVRGAASGQPNEYIKVIVNATSKMNPMKNSTVEFRIYLVVDHRILLKCSQPVQTTSAGVPTQYAVSVANIGDIEERVNLTTTGPPGWEYTLNTDEVRLKPSENIGVTLTVTPPTDAQADEVGVVTVIGRSVALPSAKSQVATHTVVTPFMYITMTADKNEDFVDPGNSTVYTLMVSNYGNVAGTVIIILEIISGTGEWITSLDTNAVGVAGGESKQVVLTVVAPSTAVAGTRLVVRVQGFNAERTVSAECMVTTIVKQVHNIRAASNPEVVALYPGEKANFQVTLTNLGNGAEVVRLGAAELPVSWQITYERSGGTVISELESLYLEPGSAMSFSAIVATTAGSLAGSYEIRGRLLDRDGNTYPIAMTVSVNQVYDIDVTTTLSKQTGVPGKKVIFTLIGKNRGNGFDTLTFDTSGLPRDWPTPEFRDINYDKNDQMALNSSALERMTLELAIPGGTNGTTVEFFVNVKSEGGVQDSVKLITDIKMANLVVTKRTYTPKTLQNNKVATITVTIENQGDVAVDNVTVRFYQDKTIMSTERLERLPGGTNRTVTFTWLAKGGAHTLKFWVDPDNLIIETNKNDNIAKEQVNVQTTGFGELPGFELPLLFLALVGGAFLAVLRKRK